jgi:hypothetical protein
MSTFFSILSLVDPRLHVGRKLGQALGEPQRNLALRRLDGVRPVDDVAADVDAEVAADGGDCEFLARNKKKFNHLFFTTPQTLSYRIVPGSDASGLVAPMILRPVATTFLPSHTMATTGALLCVEVEVR